MYICKYGLILTQITDGKMLLQYYGFRPTLKYCSFPIHRPDEIKNSHEPPAVRNFWQSLCLKRYTIKRFKKISNRCNKNVTLHIFIFNFYVQFLC